MKRSEDRDGLEDALSRIIRGGQEKAKATDVGGPGELIEWAHGYTFILLVPGGSSSDVAVEILSDKLRAGSIGFELERPFPERVDPSTAVSTCVNGVLSVRVSKML